MTDWADEIAIRLAVELRARHSGPIAAALRKARADGAEAARHAICETWHELCADKKLQPGSDVEDAVGRILVNVDAIRALKDKPADDERRQWTTCFEPGYRPAIRALKDKQP